MMRKLVVVGIALLLCVAVTVAFNWDYVHVMDVEPEAFAEASDQTIADFLVMTTVFNVSDTIVTDDDIIFPYRYRTVETKFDEDGVTVSIIEVADYLRLDVPVVVECMRLTNNDVNQCASILVTHNESVQYEIGDITYSVTPLRIQLIDKLLREYENIKEEREQVRQWVSRNENMDAIEQFIRGIYIPTR